MASGIHKVGINIWNSSQQQRRMRWLPLSQAAAKMRLLLTQSNSQLAVIVGQTGRSREGGPAIAEALEASSSLPNRHTARAWSEAREGTDEFGLICKRCVSGSAI